MHFPLDSSQQLYEVDRAEIFKPVYTKEKTEAPRSSETHPSQVVELRLESSNSIPSPVLSPLPWPSPGAVSVKRFSAKPNRGLSQAALS